MKQKINEVLKKVFDEIIKIKQKIGKSKQLLGISITVGVVLLALIIVIIAIPGDDSDVAWGMGVTEGIPAFSDDFATFSDGNGYMVAYYTDVTTEQIAEYVAKLASDCGIVFDSDKYPRTTMYNDKTITIHYNVTEKKFSVTVTQIGDNAIQENSNENQELN